MKLEYRILALWGLALASCGAEPAVEVPATDAVPSSSVETARAVVLVVVDSVRADRLGFLGFEQPTSPHLDAHVSTGHVFESAWATSPWSLPSLGSILTGELPTRHRAGAVEGSLVGEHRYLELGRDVATLGQTFSRAGYATAVFSGSPFLDPSFGLARGFETSSLELGAVPRADALLDGALAWVDEQSDPFFLFVHLSDPRLPYDPPEATRGFFTAGIDSNLSTPITAADKPKDQDDLRLLRAAYEEELSFVDQELGRFFAGLDERGLSEEAVVLLTSDHGVEQFEHLKFAEGHALWEELLHVPFVVWGPRVSPGRSFALASGVDVAPTLLEAAGIDVPEGLAGRSLVALAGGDADSDPTRSVIAERVLRGRGEVAIRVGDKKLVVEQQGDFRLYDLELDPTEQYDLADDDSETTVSLSTKLRHRMAAATKGAPASAVQLDAETRDALRAFGYDD